MRHCRDRIGCDLADEWNGTEEQGSMMIGRCYCSLARLVQAVCEESRLEKERSAVLSELTMVNTIDYRMECQVLSALHAENQLSRWVGSM